MQSKSFFQSIICGYEVTCKHRFKRLCIKASIYLFITVSYRKMFYDMYLVYCVSGKQNVI